MNDITLTSKSNKELEEEERKKKHYMDSTENGGCNCSTQSKTGDTPMLNHQRGRYMLTK